MMQKEIREREGGISAVRKGRGGKKGRILVGIIVALFCVWFYPTNMLIVKANLEYSEAYWVDITGSNQVVDSITVNGKKVDALFRPYDGTNGTDTTYSCAAFVTKFYRQVYGIDVYNLSGPSCEPLDMNGTGKFNAVSTPQVGDIVRTNYTTHWAIVKEVKGGKAYLIQQNVWNTAHTKAGVNVFVNIGDSSITFFRHSSGGGSTTSPITFANTRAAEITETSAVIITEFPLKQYEDCGFYLGTTDNLASMTKKSEGGNYANSNSYKLGIKYPDGTYRWSNPLTKGTTYYYAFYVVLNGIEYRSEILNFTTIGNKEYNLYVDPNGGIFKSGRVEPVTAVPNLEANTEVWVSVAGFPVVRTGYSLEGWYTAPTGGIKVYNADGLACNDGTIWRDNKYVYGRDLTIYAHWKATSYTLLVDPNGGIFKSGRIEPVTAVPDLEANTEVWVSVAGFPVVRTGYSLEGWYTAPTGGIKVYNADGLACNDGTIWRDNKYVYGRDLTIYAHWTRNSYYLDVNPIIDGVEYKSGKAGFAFSLFVYDGGVDVSAQYGCVNQCDYINPVPYGCTYSVVATATPEGYTFTDVSGTVGADTEYANPIWNDGVDPVFDEVKVVDVDETGYSILCKVHDNGTIERLVFPTWTHANEQDDLFPDWFNSTAIKTVNENGYYGYRVDYVAHNNEEGTYETDIYAYDMAGNKTCYVLFEDVYFLKSISLSDEQKEMSVGDTYTLELIANPSNAIGLSNVKWTTSKASVATVKNGVVTAVAPGYAIITADVNGKTATCIIAVSEAKPLVITAQPKAVTATEGTNATFKIVATGTGLTYQWQYSQDKGSTWKNSSAASAATASYVLGAKASRNGYLIRCIVTDANGKSVTSSAVKLTVTAAGPVITTQPKAVTAEEGTNATFKIVATGSGLTYQWQYSQDKGSTWKNSSAASAVTASYVLGAKASRNGYLIRCIVTDANGKSVTSSAVKLTVTAAGPVITTQPKAVTAEEGTNATFKIVATGTGLTYQWQYSQDKGSTWKNSSAASAVTASYVLGAKASRNGYLIRCIVTDANGKSVTSSAVKLTVTAAGPVITTQPKAVTAEEGTNATFKIVATGSGLTYQWQYSQDNGTTWKNSSAASAVTASYVLGAKASRNGYLIRCIVKDANGKSVTSSAVKLTVTAAGPVITTQPKAVTAVEGTNATFKIVATGSGLTYQWQYSQDKGSTWKNSGAASSVTANYVLGATASRNGYMIRCKVTAANGKTVTSSAVKLTVTAAK